MHGWHSAPYRIEIDMFKLPYMVIHAKRQNLGWQLVLKTASFNSIISR